MYDILNGNRSDIFGVSETKVDASFTDSQFLIPSFKLYWQDRDLKGRGGGIFVYIRDSIPYRILRQHSGITKFIEYVLFEVCFRTSKWFLVYYINHPKSVTMIHGWSYLNNVISSSVIQILLYFSVTSIVTCLKRMSSVTCVTYMIYKYCEWTNVFQRWNPHTDRYFSHQ